MREPTPRDIVREPEPDIDPAATWVDGILTANRARHVDPITQPPGEPLSAEQMHRLNSTGSALW